MKPLHDVQSGPAEVALSIDRVGVKNLLQPLVVRDRARGKQNTTARIDLMADLPEHFKGTHMSRFVEALAEWTGALDYRSVKELLLDIRRRLEARSAYVTFRFPYFIVKRSPATGSPGIMSYQCRFTGELGPGAEGPDFLLELTAPVMTVCPCSLALCEGHGAHSQRAEVRLSVRANGFLWLEELVELAEASGSAPVYTLVKREDEKALTEAAFARPCFVEDVVRNAAQALSRHPLVRWYRVEVESFESIHNHSAFAAIEGRGPAGIL